MSFEEKIERGLKLYLREKYGFTTVTTAFIGESEVEAGWEGCETCGYGSEAGSIRTPIHFTLAGETYRRSVDIDGTSINFLPVLLSYIDRAN